MLILSRRLNERIDIGGVITVVVLEIRGRVVRLGIEAPAGVEVDRREVREAKARDGRRGRGAGGAGPAA